MADPAYNNDDDYDPSSLEVSLEVSSLSSSSSIRGRAPRDWEDNDDHHHHHPKQSTLTTRILFETIAPHVELRTLNKLTKKIKSSMSSSMKDGTAMADAKGTNSRRVDDDSALRATRERTLDRSLDGMFGTVADRGTTTAQSVTTTTTNKLIGHSWMRRTLRAYFMGGRLDWPTRNNDRLVVPPPPSATMMMHAPTSSPPHESDPTYPPNRNRESRRDENLDMLMNARDVRVYVHPIRWKFAKKPESNIIGYEERIRERHRGKDDERLMTEAEDLLEVLASSLPPAHFDKLVGRLGAFARLGDGATGLTSSSQDRDVDASGGWYVDDDGSSTEVAFDPLPELSPSRAAANADYKKHGIPILSKFLRNCSDSHSHLVAPALAKFFYVDVGDGKEVVAADLVVVGPEGGTPEQRVLGKKHRRLNTMTEKKYDKAKDEFVKMMMELQHEFASWEGRPSKIRGEIPEISKTVVSERSDAKAGLENVECDNDDDDVSSDLLVNEFLKAQEPYSVESREEQREEVTGTLKELRLIGRKHDELRAESKMKGRGRPKTGDYTSLGE